MSGYLLLRPEAKSTPGQMAVYDNRFLPGMRDTAEAVHSAGGKIDPQLVHGGCNANSSLTSLTGLELVGPSAVQKEGQIACRSAGKKEITAIVTTFAQAAGRAKEAGLDAVQIHAARGFLLSQFLSPVFNKSSSREERWLRPQISSPPARGACRPRTRRFSTGRPRKSTSRKFRFSYFGWGGSVPMSKRSNWPGMG